MKAPPRRGSLFSILHLALLSPIGMTDAFDMGFYMKRARVGAEWLGDYSYHAEQVAALRGF